MVNIIKIIKVTKLKENTSGLDLYYGGESEFFNYDKVVLQHMLMKHLKLIENPT